MEDDSVQISDQSLNTCSPDEIRRTVKRGRQPRRQAAKFKKFCAKDERNASLKKVSVILQKSELERTFEEEQVLNDCSEVVEEVQMRWKKRDEAKRRLTEFEEAPDILKQKCLILAQAVAQSQHLVVYTGAGISTAAKIPDYRGPNGIWTRLQQGKDIGDHDLSLAEPTFTHMALAQLFRKNILKYVVSQNCDGLHLRSGLPKTALSELHGNMYIEVCKTCKPHREYWRLFDVTESTARYSHKTYRKCYHCNGPLVDTIVHFGERGSLQWPLNWAGACKNAEKATTILCLGSSLKVLKKYPWLWQMDKPAKKRPNLYIVNLQWTPKDDVANVKIHGKCDQVMEILMKLLDIHVPLYDKRRDPIFFHYTSLSNLELHTTTQPSLKIDKELENFYNIMDKDCFTNDLSENDEKSQICDNSNSKQNFNCLPSESNHTKSSAFSIDNLLQHNIYKINSNTLFHHNFQNSSLNSQMYLTPQTPTTYSLLNYSNFASNLLHYQLFGAYPDLFYYPYQTSLLYSGLHSIINPIPFTNKTIALKPITTEIKLKDELKTMNKVVNIKEPSCKFCDLNYKSLSCLFYLKTEAVFVNQQYRYSKVEKGNKPNVCVCCDYSTDEDSMEMINTDSTKEQNNSPTAELKNKIQAGWFGKGYKKNRRPKKK